MKKLLITGFDPFGGEPVNPAYEAVRLLPDVVAGIKLCKLEVPTEFVRSGAVLLDALAAERPDAVLCVGQAGGRAAITPERVAINLMDARIPDNAGFQPVDQPVVPGGPAAYFATLPVRRMAEAIESRASGPDLQHSRDLCLQLPALYAAAYGRGGIPGDARRLHPRPVRARAAAGEAQGYPRPCPAADRPGPVLRDRSHRRSMDLTHKRLFPQKRRFLRPARGLCPETIAFFRKTCYHTLILITESRV